MIKRNHTRVYLLLFLFLVVNYFTLSNQNTSKAVFDSSIPCAKHIDTCKVYTTIYKANNNVFELTIPIIVAIIGGMIAIYQVKMNVLKSARINWIENLRDNLSHFISSTQNVEHTLDLIRSEVDSGIDYKEAFNNHSNQLISAFNESSMYATKVKLYLNVREDKHKKLEAVIDDFIDLSKSKFDQRDRKEAKVKIINTTREVITLSQAIIKFEWDRVSKSLFKRLFNKVFKR